MMNLRPKTHMILVRSCFYVFILTCLLAGERRFGNAATSYYPYTRKGCFDWPSDGVWKRELGDKISTASTLYGPFTSVAWTYTGECMLDSETSHTNVLSNGKGLCMANHVCAQENCNEFGKDNMPAYTIDVRAVKDIQVALKFAKKHKIAVSVKSSGHSLQSQSMHTDSLLLWFRHFPITNIITDDFIDSCGTAHGPTLGAVAGQNFDDAWSRVKGNYNMVTGQCPTVSLSGGWIQGGGLGFTSRLYGYGLDQARSFDVVLADGSLVQADACSNSDLFWALRGGGGGNYGIVTKVEYQLHAPTKATVLNFDLFGNTNENINKAFAISWMNFILDNAPTMDHRWGGNWGIRQADMFFAGSKDDALASNLIIAMDNWYDTEVIGLGVDFGGRRPSDLLVEYESFYEARGGDEAINNPAFDVFPTIPVPQLLGLAGTPSARIITNNSINTPGFRELFLELAENDLIIPAGNYFLGGQTNMIAKEDTAMHPAMRDAVLMVEVTNIGAANRIRDLTGNQKSCLCYNHHSPLQSDWEKASWGDNFERLTDLKRQFDPDHMFNVNHGVGYLGAPPALEFGCWARNPFPNLIFFVLTLLRLLVTYLFSPF